MRQYPRELTRDCSVHKVHNVEICWEQDVKVALMDLRSISLKVLREEESTYERGGHRYCPPLKPSLHNRCIHSPNCIWQVMEIARHQPMTWKVST